MSSHIVLTSLVRRKSMRRNLKHASLGEKVLHKSKSKRERRSSSKRKWSRTVEMLKLHDVVKLAATTLSEALVPSLHLLAMV